MNRRRLVQRLLLGGGGLAAGAAAAAAPPLPAPGPRNGFRLAVLAAPGSRTHRLAQALARQLQQAVGEPVRLDSLAAPSDLASWQLREPGADSAVLLTRWRFGARLSSLDALEPAHTGLTGWTPAAVVATAPLMLVALRAVPASLTAWRDAALAQPAALRYGSDNSDAVATRIAAAWIAGLGLGQARHVPFRGPAQLLPALVGARLDVTVQSAGALSGGQWCDAADTGSPGDYGSLVAAHRAQAVTVLAVAAARRLAVLPDVPTLNEALQQAGHEAALQQVLLAPPGLRPPRLRLLAAAAASLDCGCA